VAICQGHRKNVPRPATGGTTGRRVMLLRALGFVLILFAAPLVARAQQTQTRVPRIGWLVSGSPESHGISLAAFRDGLQKLGYAEGQNIQIEYRWAQGHLDRLPELATELVRLKVDVILAGGTPGATAAKNATRVIPIVMAGVGEPVETRLVASLARPGGNLTGFAVAEPESAAKRLAILKEVAPRVSRTAVVWNPTSAYARREWKIAQESATVLRITLISQEVRTLPELESALVAVSRAHPDSLLLLNDPFVFTYRTNITEFARQAKLPAVYSFREFVTAGGLMSYGPSIAETYRRAANYVDKILKGAKPADLPVELPTKFELVINMKTAKVLGLTIPPSLLASADQVIE